MCWQVVKAWPAASEDVIILGVQKCLSKLGGWLGNKAAASAPPPPQEAAAPGDAGAAEVAALRARVGQLELAQGRVERERESVSAHASATNASCGPSTPNS